MNFSFLLITPEGFRYLDSIKKEVLHNGFEIISKHHIFSWSNVFRAFNKKYLEEKDELFRNQTEAHIWLKNYIFGDYAQVWLLKKNSLTDAALLKEITNLKLLIRSKYRASRDGTFTIIADLCKLGFNPDSIRPAYLGTFQGNSFQIIDESISQIGKFDFYFFKYVHCPDPNLCDAKREIEILEDMNVISEETIITKEEWAKITYLNYLLGNDTLVKTNNSSFRTRIIRNKGDINKS